MQERREGHNKYNRRVSYSGAINNKRETRIDKNRNDIWK